MTKAKKVKIQKKLNSSWKTVKQVKVRKGKFRTSVAMPKAPEVTFRAKAVKPRGVRGLKSKPITFRSSLGGSTPSTPAPTAPPPSGLVQDDQRLGVPGAYQFPSDVDVQFGQPFRIAPQSPYLFDDLGPNLVFFKIPVTVTNNSRNILDGGYFTYVGDVEAGTTCDTNYFDNQEIVRIQPGLIGYGDMIVVCPASTVGSTFTLDWTYNPGGLDYDSYRSDHFLIGRVP